jgi:hypothetical protein
MAISLTCSCGKRLNAKDEHAGKRVKCPACGAVLTVESLPMLEEAPPIPARYDAVTLEVGHVRNIMGYIHIAVRVAENGDGRVLVILCEDGKRNGHAVSFDVSEYREVDELFRKTAETVLDLQKSGRMR